jgi:hypothetical protein
MDDLRNKDDRNTKEIKYLKDRLKMFDNTSASGFKGFNQGNGSVLSAANQALLSPNL